MKVGKCGGKWVTSIIVSTVETKLKKRITQLPKVILEKHKGAFNANDLLVFV